MEKSIEYQIFIGCTDSQSHDEVVSGQNLTDLISLFFTKKMIDFSLLSAKGGYTFGDGSFITENTICINFIGTADLDIFKLAKSLSMFMNQECVMVTRNNLQKEFR